MRKTTSRLLAAAAALQVATGPLAAQDAPQVFRPAGQWTADFGDDYCRLMRTFSDGADTISFALERIEPGAGMRLVLVGNAIKPFRRADELGWSFLPAGDERRNRYIVSTTADGQAYYNLGRITLAPMPSGGPGAPPTPPAPYDRDAEQTAGQAVEAIRVTTGLTAPIEIQTGALGAPMKVLQACADDLVNTWGVDFEKNKTASRAVPDGMGAGWLPQGTVAFTDFAKLGGDSNLVRLMIDAEGTPTACSVHFATLEAATNEKICATLMKTAHFTPSRDAAGNAMASYWIGSPLSLMPPFRGGRGRR